MPFGFMVGARGGYELPAGLGFEIGGGYLSMAAKVERHIDERFGADNAVASHYEMRDTLKVRGPYVFAGVSYRLALSALFEAQGRVDLGAWITTFSDTFSGVATAGGVTRDVYVTGSGKAGHGAAAFVMPGIDVYLKKGHWRAGIGLSAMVIVTDGPKLPTGNTHVKAQSCAGNLQSIDCAPQEDFTQGEKAYGRFVSVMPQASVGYVF